MKNFFKGSSSDKQQPADSTDKVDISPPVPFVAPVAEVSHHLASSPKEIGMKLLTFLSHFVHSFIR